MNAQEARAMALEAMDGSTKSEIACILDKVKGVALLGGMQTTYPIPVSWPAQFEAIIVPHLKSLGFFARAVFPDAPCATGYISITW